MQNKKIEIKKTKNINNSPTLKINIVLNVQNIKEIKVFWTSLNSVASLMIKFFNWSLTFHAIHLTQNKRGIKYK